MPGRAAPRCPYTVVPGLLCTGVPTSGRHLPIFAAGFFVGVRFLRPTQELGERADCGPHALVAARARSMPQHLLTPESGGSLSQEMAASLTRLRELRGRLTSASVCRDFAFSLPEVGEASLPEGVTVGSAVLAPGLHAGQKKPFRAVLLGVRNIFPPLLVRYVATLDGRTIPLLLPEIRSTYLPSSDVSKFDEVARVSVSVSVSFRIRDRARVSSSTRWPARPTLTLTLTLTIAG